MSKVFLIVIVVLVFIVTPNTARAAEHVAEGVSFFAYSSSLRGGYYVSVGNVLNDYEEEIVTGTGDGFAPHVRIFDGRGNLKSQFYAFDSSSRNGVTVTTCDVNNNGYEEIITAQGNGQKPLVRIFNGYGEVINSGFYALDGQFTGGINVSCGDTDGDGRGEIVVAAMHGGGPHVMVYDAVGHPLVNFFAYGSDFRGGINVTTIDMDGDGRDEIVAGPQYGAPHVQIFQIRPHEIKQLSPGFFSFGSDYRGGVDLGGADINGDGTKEMLVSVGREAEPEVKIYNVREELLNSFTPFDSTFYGGVHVSGGDVDGDYIDEIIVMPRSDGGPNVRIIDVATRPQNVILLIGDGMGPEQVKAGSYFQVGTEQGLNFERFSFQAEVTTQSADSAITDSAAAATAMATGVKVNNGVISLRTPGNQEEIETLLEMYKDDNKSTGLVTTASMTHATPAAFGAHVANRNMTSDIAEDYLDQTKPQVLFGGGGSGISPSATELAGYEVVLDRDSLLAIDTATATYISGQFGSGHMNYELDGIGSQPHLSEMASVALDILDNDADGFFLMIESGRIDHAGHGNNIGRLVSEVVEFSDTVQSVLDWAGDRTDTLVLVTADHETGGLDVVSSNAAGNVPNVSWSTTGHTSTNVPVYAWGSHASTVTGVLDNTDLFAILGN